MGRDLRSLSILAATLVAVPHLGASGFQLREQNPAAQGNSFAGATAGFGGLGSSYFNPAVLATVDGREFLVGLSGVMPRAELEGAVGTRNALLPAPLRTISGPSTHADAAHDAVLPNLYAAWAVGQDLRLGVAVSAPYGLVTEYQSDFVGRYHALKSDLKTVDVAFSAAYRVSGQWAVGATLLYRKAEAEISSAADFGLGVSPQYAGAFDGTATLKGSKGAVGYKVGVLYTPSSDLRIGFGYQGAMTMELVGDATYSFHPATPAPVLAGLAAKGFRPGEGKADLKLPSTTSVGFDWKLDDTYSLQGEAALTGWSTFQELRVRFSTGLPDSVTEEHWKDAWFVSLGLNYKASEAWTLRTGVAFDQSAVEDSYRTPRIPDADRTWVSVGASWAATRALTLDFGVSHIMVKKATLNLSAGTSPANPDFTRGNLTGTYKSGIEVVAVGARYRF